MVFGEQVAGADGREWLAAVRADLEGDGYAVGVPICALRASARRTSGNGSGGSRKGWPTPNTPSGGPNVKSTATHTGGMDLDER